MKGFIINTTYRIHNEKPNVYLFGRLENGESFVAIKEQEPYFYVKTKDAKKIKKEKIICKKTDLTNFKKENVTKVIVKEPKDVPGLRKLFEEQKIECYEADIRFTQRFLIDNHINATCNIEGDYETADTINRVYKEPEIKAQEADIKLKTLSFDIETSPDAKELYCISLYTDNYKKVLIKAKEKYQNAESFQTEEDLLEAFIKKIREIDPDIIIGWNCIDFDLQILKELHKKNRVPFTYGRDNTTNQLRIETNFFRDSKATISGRMVLDGIHILKNSFIKLDNYKLETAAKTILNDNKLITGENRGDEIERLYKKDKQKLIEYNLKDAELAYKILEKTGALALTIKRSQITGLPLDRVSASIASLDSLYIQEAQRRKIVVPSTSITERQERILGGYVKESEPGIYNNIVVLDFKSLYPSIIRTFNIDPFTYTKEKKGTIESPNGAHFTYEEGILPTILEKVWKERDLARKKKDELTRYALKITMNSFYGSLASPNSRFYNREIGNAITHFAQYFNKRTAMLCEEAGHHVIYGDTDSSYLNTKAKTQKEAEKIGREIVKDIDKFYDKYIKENYKRKSYLELEYEKCYAKFIMFKLRGATQGAKKRYAGLLKEDNKEKIEFVGLEVVRSDWTKAARKFQRELIEKVFHEESVDKFIRDFVKKLENGKMDEDLVYQKQMRKEEKEYTRITPPHVKAARKLATTDEETNVIQYVMTTDGPEPIQNQKHKIDYEHYIEKQIKPIADQVLEFYGLKFSDILKGVKQTTLFNT